MAKSNLKIKHPPILTHEGARAVRIGAEAELRRSVMACMLWEDSFYESGQSIADRIKALVAEVEPEAVAKIAVEARTAMKLRHVPLLLARELARKHGKIVASLLPAIIQRADELAEFLAIYWKDGKDQPVSAGVKRGLAQAFTKFNAYQLAKYNRDGAVKLRDVLFLCHAKPKDEAQAATWKQLVDNTLPVPDTWEVALSGGADKKQTWERLIGSDMLGDFALIRNLRNMEQAGVDRAIVRQALATRTFDRILPFRFLAAAKAAPEYDADVDAAMLRVLGQMPKLPGRTVVVIDVSGSMYNRTVSAKSDMDRAHAACALGAIARELCESAAVYATAGNDGTRIHKTAKVPARRGLPLVDAIYQMCRPLGGGGIFLNQVCNYIREQEKTADRTIVITDEQDCGIGSTDSPDKATPLGRGYMINVNSYKNGIGYKPKWTHIDGWSEAVLSYIQAAESVQ